MLKSSGDSVYRLRKSFLQFAPEGKVLLRVRSKLCSFTAFHFICGTHHDMPLPPTPPQSQFRPYLSGNSVVFMEAHLRVLWGRYFFCQFCLIDRGPSSGGYGHTWVTGHMWITVPFGFFLWWTTNCSSTLSRLLSDGVHWAGIFVSWSSLPSF